MRELTRAKALWILGLPGGSTDEEVLLAYGRLSRPVKRRLVRAPTVDLRDECKAELRKYVRARNFILGRNRLPPPPPLPVEPLLHRLLEQPVEWGDRFAALAALDLPPDAGDDAARTAYGDRYRLLSRALAKADDEARMVMLQEARRRMRRIRRVIEHREEPFALPDAFTEDEDLTDSFGVPLVAAPPSPERPVEPEPEIRPVAEAQGAVGEESFDFSEIEITTDEILLESQVIEPQEIEPPEAEPPGIEQPVQAAPAEVRPPIEAERSRQHAAGAQGTGPDSPFARCSSDREVTTEYRRRVTPLRVEMLTAVDEEAQRRHLRAIRELRRARDRALSSGGAGSDAAAAPFDESLLDLDTREFDQFLGLGDEP